MLKVETDTYSYPHVFLADQLLAASKTVQPKNPRAQKLIESLKDWNGIADADSPLVSFLEMARRASLHLLLEPYLGDGTNLYEWRSTTFLQKILTNRPSNWIPPAYKSYDELLAAAADRAVSCSPSNSKATASRTGSGKNLIRSTCSIPSVAKAFSNRCLSITGKPQSGTLFSVRAATTHHGPSMRFIANLANWDDSVLLIPAGESGQLGSGHYTDQFSYWYEGKPIFMPFTDPAEAKTRRHSSNSEAISVIRSRSNILTCPNSPK